MYDNKAKYGADCRRGKRLAATGLLALILAAALLLPACSPEDAAEAELPPRDEQSSQAPPPEPEPETEEAPAQYYPTDILFTTEDRDAYRGGMTLSAPGMFYEGPVLPDVEAETLKDGVGLYQFSPMPNGAGINANVSIAGHRDLYGFEFYDIDKLSDGDQLYITYEGLRYVYTYEYTEIIEADDWSVIYCTDYPCLTLTSCDPIGVADRRIIVRARLTGVEELE